MKQLFSPYQYGFRKDRKTAQALLDLQSGINESTLRKSSLYSVFFDLQKAFPRVWRCHIVNKLYKLELRGNLPSILQSFLNDRTLIVRIQNITSSPFPIKNGVSQGEVLSVLLFLVPINDTQNVLNSPSYGASSRRRLQYFHPVVKPPQSSQTPPINTQFYYHMVSEKRF